MTKKQANSIRRRMSKEAETAPLKLSPKQENFCVSFSTIGGEGYSNATAAALEAGYSEAYAHNAGWRNLRVPAVRQRILDLQRMQVELADADPVDDRGLGELELVPVHVAGLDARIEEVAGGAAVDVAAGRFDKDRGT